MSTRVHAQGLRSFCRWYIGFTVGHILKESKGLNPFKIFAPNKRQCAHKLVMVAVTNAQVPNVASF